MTYEELNNLFIAFVKEHGQASATSVLKEAKIERLCDLKASDMDSFVKLMDKAHDEMKPKTLYVHLTIIGEQGAGKSVLSKIIERQFDGIIEELHKTLPKTKVLLGIQEFQRKV